MYHSNDMWREKAHLPMWQLLLRCYFFAGIIIGSVSGGIAIPLLMIIAILCWCNRKRNKVGCLFCRSRNVCVNNNLHFNFCFITYEVPQSTYRQLIGGLYTVMVVHYVGCRTYSRKHACMHLTGTHCWPGTGECFPSHCCTPTLPPVLGGSHILSSLRTVQERPSSLQELFSSN